MKQTDHEILADYQCFLRRKRLSLFFMLLLLIACFIFSLCAGSSQISLKDLVQAIMRKSSRQLNTIIWNVRMPRTVTAVVVGWTLGLSGCVMQNVLRNPLASASTLGVSQGASFGAAAAIVCLGAGIQVNAGGTTSAIAITNPYLVTVCAFLGGIATTLLILALSGIRGMTPGMMVLAGVAISSLFTGATTLIQYFADDVMVASVVYWTFGNLGRAGWRDIAINACLTSGASVYFYGNRWNYNAMESGANTAKSLGVHVDRLILLSMTLCSLIAATSVAFVGCIQFVGLIAPHICRRFTGNDHRFLLPASALCGAMLLLLADIASRLTIPPVVLPIGALTSFLGAPLFLYLIIKGGRAA